MQTATTAGTAMAVPATTFSRPAITDRSTIAALRAHSHRTVDQVDAGRARA